MARTPARVLSAMREDICSEPSRAIRSVLSSRVSVLSPNENRTFPFGLAISVFPPTGNGEADTAASEPSLPILYADTVLGSWFPTNRTCWVPGSFWVPGLLSFGLWAPHPRLENAIKTSTIPVTSPQVPLDRTAYCIGFNCCTFDAAECHRVMFKIIWSPLVVPAQVY